MDNRKRSISLPSRITNTAFLLQQKQLPDFGQDCVVFDVQLVNKLRQRKPRYFIINRRHNTLYRADQNADNVFDAFEYATPRKNHKIQQKNNPLPKLRKPKRITSSLSISQHETDPCRIKISTDQGIKGQDLIFGSLSDRNRFVALIDVCRRSATKQSEKKRSRKLSKYKQIIHDTNGEFSTSSRSKFSIYTTTWNVGGKKIPSLSELKRISKWIPQQYHDIYVFALQECKAKCFPEWQHIILNYLNNKVLANKSNKNSEYEIVASTSMWAISITVYVHKSLVSLIDNIQTDSKACGVGNLLGNKGAVGVKFIINGDSLAHAPTSLAFVNSHLAARAERLIQREMDYVDICRSLFHDSTTGTAGSLLHTFDHLWWLGDLNYRVDLGDHGSEDDYYNVLSLIEQEYWDALVQCDQLTNEIANHNVFVGFQEGKIEFAPTYRMEVGIQGHYNNKRNQCPSWTDRIMWRSVDALKPNIQITSYNASHSLCWSDHRPVYATFDLQLAKSTALLQICRNAGFAVPRSSVVWRKIVLSKLAYQVKGIDISNDQVANGSSQRKAKHFKNSRHFHLSNIDGNVEDSPTPQKQKGIGFTTVETSFQRLPDASTDKISTGLGGFRSIDGFGRGKGERDIVHQALFDDIRATRAYDRYVERCENGVPSSCEALQICFHGKIEEETVSTQPLESDSREQAPLKGNESVALTYIWNKNDVELSSINPHVVATITSCGKKWGKSGTVFGAAQVCFDEIIQNNKDKNSISWFSVPVLRQGQPAGILKGIVEFDSYQPNLQQVEGPVAALFKDSSKIRESMDSLGSLNSNESDFTDMTTRESWKSIDTRGSRIFSNSADDVGYPLKPSPRLTRQSNFKTREMGNFVVSSGSDSDISSNCASLDELNRKETTSTTDSSSHCSSDGENFRNRTGSLEATYHGYDGLDESTTNLEQKFKDVTVLKNDDSAVDRLYPQKSNSSSDVSLDSSDDDLEHNLEHVARLSTEEREDTSIYSSNHDITHVRKEHVISSSNDSMLSVAGSYASLEKEIHQYSGTAILPMDVSAIPDLVNQFVVETERMNPMNDKDDDVGLEQQQIKLEMKACDNTIQDELYKADVQSKDEISLNVQPTKIRRESLAVALQAARVKKNISKFETHIQPKNKVIASVKQNVQNVKEYDSAPRYSYEWILKHKSELDPTCLQGYLNDTDFQSVFGLTKEVFDELPKWRQDEWKKRVNLF